MQLLKTQVKFPSLVAHLQGEVKEVSPEVSIIFRSGGVDDTNPSAQFKFQFDYYFSCFFVPLG